MWQLIAVSLKWRRGEGFFSSLEVTKRNDGTSMRYNHAADTPWHIYFPLRTRYPHTTRLFFPSRECSAAVSATHPPALRVSLSLPEISAQRANRYLNDILRAATYSSTQSQMHA